MSTITDGDLHLDRSSFSLAADQRRAELLLADLAMELRRVPVDERTRGIHLRALALKRAVMDWPKQQPDESIRHAVVDEVLAMQEEAVDWRRLSTSERIRIVER
jgi:hypothetical protein